jgi:sugar lactone lactonase YvrE
MTTGALAKLMLTFSVLVLPVRAASTIYTYTGNAFNQFFGSSGDTTANFMTVSITLASPLPASFGGVVTPTAWSISDGTNTISSSSLGVIYTLFDFTTNSGGAIVSWQVSVDTNSVGLGSTNPAGIYDDGVENVTIYDGYANRTVNGVDASNGTVPGTWTVQSAQSQTILAGNTAGTSSVVLNYGGPWTAVSNNPFLHISAGSASGTGSAVVVFTYDAFTGTGTRTGTLTIANLTVIVTQAGTNYVPANPVTTLVSTGLYQPYGVAVDGSGNVYIADTVNNAIKEWSAATQQVTTLVSGLNFPRDVAVDNSGNVYIADFGNNAIKEWSAATQQVTTLVSAGLSGPCGVAVDGFGNVYIADANNQAIKEWVASTQQVTTLVQSELNYPQGVAVDAAGNVYIADTNNYAIKEWNQATQQVTTLVSTAPGLPKQVAVDGSGNLYTADQVNQTIDEWSAATQQLTTLVSSGLYNPTGVAVDGSGNVYIADTSNYAIKEIPNAFVGPASLTELASAGSDSLLPVLPATAALTGIFAPTSDQSWLTIGNIANGVVNFSFTANTSGAARIAHISLLGQQITVTQNVVTAPTVTFTGAPATAPYHGTFTVAATTNASTTAVITASGSCTIAGVTVTISAPTGSCSLLATWAADSNYLAASATQSTAATKATPAINWTIPAAITYGTALSGTQLDATATSNGSSVAGTFVYSPPTATVLAAGPQTLSVTFTPNNTADYTSASASVTLQVNQATPKITWAKPAAITYDTALSGTQLDATASVPGSFVYSPAAGTVLTAGTQTLSVTFTPSDPVDYATATGTVTITVSKAAPLLTWNTPAIITYGTPLSIAQLDATASVPGNFVYSPAAGAIEPGGSDKLSVTFTPDDATDYTTATASVMLQVTAATPTINWTAPAAIAYGTALSGTQLNATATLNGASAAGTFVYSPPTGTVLTGGAQTLLVTFTPNNTANYTGATGSVTLQVNQATPKITWAKPAAITYGTTLSSTQLDATAPVNGNFAYTPPAGTLLTAGTQTLSVTFTPTDTIDYAAATGTVTITVSKAAPPLTWTTPAPIAYGTPLGSAQLDATASTSGTFAYSPAAGAIEPGGSDKLSVTFTPTDTVDYTTATASVMLQVNPATPAINWTAPAAIAYGTALSGTQLNATAASNGASVAGTFVYSPPTGTVLAANAQTLSVTFFPNNTADYTSASASVTLQVSQGPFVDVTGFGAVGDGATDNTAAFVAAFAAACASPTSTTVNIPSGIFVVNPNPSPISICSGVTVTGTGTIKVASGAGTYGAIFAPSPSTAIVRNFTLADISIDQNADGNSAPTVGNGAGAQTILQIFAGSNITVRNIKASVSGVNSIDINGPSITGVTITANYFVFHNPTQSTFDNSTIYIAGTNFTVSNNVFSSTLSDSARTAIEVHSGTGTISGNSISYYASGMNVVDTQQTQVTGNTITSAQNGILLWAVSGMNGTTVSGNSITVDNVERAAAASSGISLYDGSDAPGPNSNLSISGNIIVCQQVTSPQAVSPDYNYGIGLQAYGSLTNAVVANNKVINAPVRGIKAGVVFPSLASNIQIVNNTIVDPGTDADSVSLAIYYDAAIALDGNLTGVTVTGNSLQFTTNPLHLVGSTYPGGTYSVYASVTGATFTATFTQVAVYDNTVISFAGNPALYLAPTVITSH